ncbi:MAG: hypothetical protein D6814_15155, partial [Calditrichaeota bacterium]
MVWIFPRRVHLAPARNTSVQNRLQIHLQTADIFNCGVRNGRNAESFKPPMKTEKTMCNAILRIGQAGCLWLLLITASAWSAPQSVPKFSQVAGHGFGERISLHREAEQYLQTLAKVSPRVQLITQGKTYEQRTQYALVVTSPENLQRLEEIRSGIAKLADPRNTSLAGAKRLIHDLPVIAYLGGSIHGFELSGSEALLKLIQHLTTQNDAETREILQNVVAVIDPMLNPDGRDAFVEYNHLAIGRVPNPERDDWANTFSRWEALKYRTNHYFFDLNRDWFAHTQIETRNRIKTVLSWHPQVVVDAHEMGSDFEFYLDPGAAPNHIYYPKFARKWLQRFGRAYAAAFDSAGFEYMTRERYNYYYPGYTTSWTSYQGAAGMLFEQGSSRGLAITRPDHSVRTLKEALSHHFLGALTALRTAARQRSALLQDYYQAHVEAIQDGKQGIRRYLLPPGGDAALTTEAAAMLRRNGIEVQILTQPATLLQVRDREGRSVGRHTFPAGTFVIEAAQPLNRLVRVLLEPDAPLPKAFLEQARQRADRGENPRFYDITAWSIPLLFNIPGYSTSDGRTLPASPWTGTSPAAANNLQQAGYAYLLDGREAGTVAALFHLTARGFRVAMLLRDSQIGGEKIYSGAGVIRVGENPAEIHQAVHEVARKFHLQVRAVSTGLSDEGFPALGSEYVRPLKKPEIALVGEHPIHGYSFGHAWFVLDRQYEIPVTILRAWSLANTPLTRFTTLILPNLNRGQFNRVLGPAGKQRLTRWVKDGGTLVAIGEGALFVAKELGLAAIKSWADTADNPAARTQVPLLTPGAFLRTEFVDHHWLGAGYAVEMPALVYSSRILLPPEGPPTLPQRKVAIRFANEHSIRIAGQIWPDVQKRMAGAVFAYEQKQGRGRVILFAEDPNFRGYWRGADRLFLNAVLFG